MALLLAYEVLPSETSSKARSPPGIFRLAILIKCVGPIWLSMYQGLTKNESAYKSVKLTIAYVQMATCMHTCIQTCTLSCIGLGSCTSRAKLAPRTSYTSLIMSSDPTKFAYVCLCRKPYGLSVNCQVTLVLYRGNFELTDLANKVVPLTRGEMVAFPPGTLDSPACAWSGLAARCL